MKINKLFNFFGLEAIMSSSRKELENLEKNLTEFDDATIERYIKEDKESLLYCFKSKEWKGNSALLFLSSSMENLMMLKQYKGEDDGVYKLMKKCAMDERYWRSSVVNYYNSNEMKKKVEKLLKGLSFNEDIFVSRSFVKNLNENGVKNYRKFYGDLPKTDMGLNFLNLTDDLNFLKKLPDLNSSNAEIRTNCTLDELKNLRDESLKKNYSFSFLLGHYNYKDYEDDLIEFEKNNKELLKKMKNCLEGNRDIKSYLKALNFFKKNEGLLNKLLEKYDFINKYTTMFVSDLFALGKTEKTIREILEKAMEKSFYIKDVYRFSGYSNLLIGYLGDVILRLNSYTNSTKLRRLCFLASLVGLDDERFEKALKSKVSASGVEEIYKNISAVKQEEIFEKNFKINGEEFLLKSGTGVELKEEDLEKVKYLQSKGYKLIDIYENLKSIDNIIYLINNGYDVAWNFMDYVKPFYDKEDLDDIFKYHISLPSLSEAYIYNHEEVIRKILQQAFSFC